MGRCSGHGAFYRTGPARSAAPASSEHAHGQSSHRGVRATTARLAAARGRAARARWLCSKEGAAARSVTAWAPPLQPGGGRSRRAAHLEEFGVGLRYAGHVDDALVYAIDERMIDAVGRDAICAAACAPDQCRRFQAVRASAMARRCALEACAMPLGSISPGNPSGARAPSALA